MRWLSLCAALCGCTGVAGLDELTFGGGGSTGGAGGQGGDGGTGAGGEGGGGGEACALSVEARIVATTGLEGDGYLSIDPCVQSVWDYYPQPSGCSGAACAYFAIHMGVDPACTQGVIYRLFVRFPIADLALRCVASARLRLFYVEKTSGVAHPARLLAIEDFFTLDMTDWNLATVADLGVFVSPTTMENTWLEADVSAVVIAAREAGADHVAFELRYEDESHNPVGMSGWYGIVAADNAEKQPELLVSGE